jgi:hypothetical protein
MEKIIKYLKDTAGPDGCYIRHLNSLVFAFGNFEISIGYTLINEVESEDFEELDNVDDLLKDISNINFQHFFISFSEMMEDRGIFSEPFSISNSLFDLVKKLNKIDETLVLKYEIKVEDPNDSGMCGYYPQYIGEIEINYGKLDVKTLEKILHELHSFELIQLTNSYALAIGSEKKLKNTFSPQFLNTNTKVRRLGYLKLFFKFIDEKKKVPQNFINKKFEEFTLQFSSQLSDLSNNKGIIQNLSGKSAEPYISLLKEMDLITIINRVVVPTKWLKTYLVLRNNFIDETPEVFVLDKVDKIFLMEIILRKDFFYSIVILEFLCVRETCTTHEIINNFQKLLLQRIENLLNQATYKDEKGVSQLKEIEKRVMAWKKAEVYLEHIIMPRINWYADLDIITLSDNIITVNENGKRLLGELNSWVDIEPEYVADSTDFLKKFYPHVYAKSYFGSYGVYPDKEIIHGLVDQYINESFVLFKTLAPNRVTSSQAFTFAKYSFYFKNGFSVSENYLARIVEEAFSNKYIYKFQPRYGDGYIQKIQLK